MTYQSGGLIDDQDYDYLVDRYNAAFSGVGGLGVGKKAEGEIVTRLDWYFLWQKVHDMAKDQNRAVVLPELPGYPGQNPWSAELIPTFNSLISALGPWGELGPVQNVVTVCWAPLRVTGNEPTTTTGGGTSPSGGGAINQSWTTAGTYDYVVPDYATLTVVVSGGGGGGAANYFDLTPTYPGQAGGASSFNGVTAYGGAGGVGGYAPPAINTGYVPPSVPAGPDSGAVGGDTNIVGGGGKAGGGYGYSLYEDTTNLGSYSNGAGSGGGKATKTWTAGAAGAPAPGSTIKVYVGEAGKGGCIQMQTYGNYGAVYKDTDGSSTCAPGKDCIGSYGGGGSVIVSGTLKTVPGTPPPPPAGASFITFRALLDKASTQTVTVTYATSDVSSTSPTTTTTPFSQEYTKPGTYQYTVPNYTTMTVEVAGAGGGDGFAGNPYASDLGTPLPPQVGHAGGDSVFATVVGQGGPGGPNKEGQVGAPGGGSGGNTTPGGGADGGTPLASSSTGNGDVSIYTPAYPAGGKGGKTVKTWTAGTAGAPGPGAVITVVVGKGGDAAMYENYNCEDYLTISNWQKGYEQCLSVRGKDGWIKINGLAAGEGVNVSGAGHATAGADYTPVSGTLTFAPGETYKDVQVPILADNLPEPDEDFNITLSNPVNANLCSTPVAVGVILGASLPTGPGTVTPPPPPPPPDVPGKWMPYYVPRLDLGTDGFFWGQQYWSWIASPTHPTPDLPLPLWGESPWAPLNPTNTTMRYTQGELGASIGDNVSLEALQGKMSLGGDPYQDPSQEIYQLPGYYGGGFNSGGDQGG